MKLMGMLDCRWSGGRTLGSSILLGTIGCLITSSVAQAGYFEQVTNDNPVIYWRLGESSGTTAADSTTPASSGTYANGVTLGQSGALFGDPNTAALFDGASGPTVDYNPAIPGVTDYLHALPPSEDLNNSTYSVALWVYNQRPYGDNQVAGTLFSRGTSGNASAIDVLVLGGLSGNQGKLRLYNGISFLEGTTSLSLNTWYHIALVRNNNTVTVYLNGSPEMSGTLTKTFTGDDVTFGLRLDDYFPFQGKLDEISIYNYDLSNERAYQHFLYGSTGVPEPTSGMLIGMAGVALLARRRRGNR